MIALPILIPLAMIILLLLPVRLRFKRAASIAGTCILLIVSVYIFFDVRSAGILVMKIGSWPTPYGIPLVVDLFSAIMLVISGIVGFCISIYAVSGINKMRHRHHFYLFSFGILLGVNGSFLTGDVFNLYVWFEVLLMASFALLVLGNSKEQLEGGIKYVTLNLISSFFFLAGIGLLYGETGTLNMADLALTLKNNNSELITTSAMLFFIAFAIKSALFPFFYWLPASYHTPPSAVTALFAGLLTKVGVYALIRFFTLFFIHNNSFWLPLLIIISGATMLVAVLMATAQTDLRRLFSFDLISQIGFMIMGLGIHTPLAIAGSIYFVFHNVVAKVNVFLITGTIHYLKKTYYIKHISGIYKQYPFLALLFFISAMSLAGLPPLSGFFGKFILLKASLDSEQYIITAVAIITTMLTAYLMVKVWNKVFFKSNRLHPELNKPKKVPVSLIIPSIILALITIMLGLGAGYTVDVCHDTAVQLLDRVDYINAVLGEQNK